MSGNATALGAQARSVDPPNPEWAAAAAHRLLTEAKENSRLARYHHSKARTQFRKLRKFVADLEAMGIEVVLEDPPAKPQSPRRQSDDRSSRDPT